MHQTSEHCPDSEQPVALVRFDLPVADVEASLDFYHKLGFVLASYADGDGGKYNEADMKAGVVRLGLSRGNVATAAERAVRKQVRLILYLSGGPAALDDFRSRLIRSGIKPSPLSDHGSLRQFTLEDPDGYVIGFNTNVQ